MQDIVQDAMSWSEEESNQSNSTPEFGQPQIAVIGCGGAGNNTVNRLHNIGIEGAETIALNTDRQHLKMIEADTKVLVGESITDGLGAGGDPETGERATEMASGTLQNLLSDMDLVFVTGGLGGGTGTGSLPVVSKLAKDEGAIVIGMVSTPFQVERARLNRAREGLFRLEQESDSIIVLDNERLLDYVPNLPLKQAFSVMDQIISETVKGISETITRPSLINLDYADMKSTMRRGGVSVMLYGETQGKNKTQVVDEALRHPLLNVDYRGATGGLVHITGGPNLALKDAESIASGVTEDIDPTADVIWGARVNEAHEGQAKVMAVLTGVDSDRVIRQSAVGDIEDTSAAGNNNGRSNKEPAIDTVR